MKILFTGSSSFTGYWFIKELVNAGYDVTSVYTGKETDDYSGIRKERVKSLQNFTHQVFDCTFGSDKFLALLREEKFDILCHHAAEVKDYKNPDYNALRALQLNTWNLNEVLRILDRNDFTGIVLTGSVFEANEGQGGDDEKFRDAFSPYGLSKTLTFDYFKYYCSAHRIRLGKFVIPNPFGPYEEPRFTNYLIKTWRNNKIAEVNTPLYIRDNIHVDLLAAVYVDFMKKFANGNYTKINPSGYAEPMSLFTRRFSEEMKVRLNLPCEIQFNEQKIFSEPLKRINTDPARELIKNWNEKKAWDKLAEYYKSLDFK